MANGHAQFDAQEAPTAPRRTYSGAPIKGRVIRAMDEQRKAFRQCNEAADKLMDSLRKTDSLPPSPGGE
jgi:hypothetical protein